MAIIKKFSPFLNLSNFQVFLNDTQRTSQYFRISDFGDTFTGGKNGFLIEGSEFLKETTEIKIEILDVNGNPIYFEPGDGIPEYYEGISKLVSVHIYDDTPIGLGKITILGELKNYVNENGTILPIPDEWKGIYNVKWERTFQINRNLNNETIVRFYKRPQVTITELVKPIFSKSVPTVTDTGYVHGIPELPPFGTDIRTWRAGTLYKLQRTSGSWDRDVDENTITISNPSHTAKIIEVLNDREVLVDIPYTTSNNVSSFLSGSYSVTYSDFQNEIIGESTLTGSFAKIDITQLKTFVGDVARVKVFRKSRNSVGDFQFVQESKLESSELLRDITTSTDTELSYGLFDEYNLSNYWETSSIDHPTTINSSVLSQAVKVDYNGSGVQKLITSQSFSLSKDVEYTLNFRTLLSGSTTPNKTLKAYFSGSNFTQDFLTISGSSIYTTRQNVSQNILSENTGNAKLVFEFKGDDWYLSNVSLKNAQDTSFSPDEFTLIQDIPRKLASETFDFRFEFYDINNNYIPVNVGAVGVFDGGNDYPTSGKLLTFESDRNAFRFSSGSVQNPIGQQIQLKVTQNNLTGSVTFASSAFDVDGNYLQPSDYTQYPGLLTSVNPAGAIITINNFTGSRVDGLYIPFVGSVVYTASLENLQEFETVYRLEDGDNAPQLIVTSNANQFIYEPTTLSPKPSGQSITVRAQRKNLASLVTPLEINSSSNAPLTYVDTVSGIDTYTISATEFSASFAQNNFDEITYSFTGSDVFGNEQSDEITISKVVNFDGLSVVLSNESVTFPAYSTGEVVGGFNASSGSVQMYIGGNQIQFDDSLSKNTFAITNLQGSGCTPFGGNGYDPLNNSYSISAMSTDSAQMNVTITYKAGDNSTTQQFEKVVSYTKAKDAVPNVEVSVTPNAQTVTSDSDGGNTSTPTSLVVRALEGGSTRLTTVTATGTGVTAGDAAYNPTSGSPKNYATIPLSAVTDDNSSVAIVVNYTDSEGTSGSKNLTATISRSKKASPVVVANLSSEAQTITKTAGGTYGTPATFTVSVNEGGSNYTYTTGTVTENKFKITSVTGAPNNNDGTITPTIPTTDAGTTVSMTISYVNSEGTAGTITKTHKVGVTTDGSVGADGVTIVPSKTSQNIVRDFEDLTFTTIQAVSHAVKQGSTTFTAVSSATALANSQYRIKPASLTNCTESADGEITPTQPTDLVFTTGGTASYTIQYKDGDGNENEVAFTHEVTVTTNGTTGPGVVFSGEWASGVQYQFSTGVTGRRDAVIYSGTYYAVTAAHTSTSSGTTGPPGVGTNWESLGTGTRFSAAEISISKQSFIKETLTIGTNDIGSAYSANITLFGGNAYPYIAVGQATVGYGNNGIWIGNDGGTSKFSLVNGTSSFLKWNGSSLEIKGSISFTNQNDIDLGSFNNDVGFTDDTAANNAQDAADAAQSDATTALTRPKVFRQASPPSTSETPGGSLWYDTDDSNKLYILVGSTWTLTRDGGVTQALADAAAASSAASGVSDDLQDLIDGTAILGGGTFINGDIVYSPILAGANGYISNIFKVGNNGITLDGPNKKIFTGTGAFANSNTPFYVDNSSNFSLGDKLSWNGTTLSIAGTVEIGGTTASTIESNAANAVQPGDNVSTLNNNSGYQNNTATRTGGSVGGWGIEQYKIKGGAPTVGGDGTFTDTGIIFGIESVTGGGYISAQQFYISSSGDAVFSGVVSAGSIQGGEININNNFTVDSLGNMNATNANISGSIETDQATLGSWLVDEDSITAQNGDITLNATDGYIYLKQAGVTKVNLNTGSNLSAPGAGGTLGPASYTAADKTDYKVLSVVGYGAGGETSYQNITSFTPTTGGNWNLGYSYENGSSTYVQASGLGCSSGLNVYLDVLSGGYTGTVLKSTFIAGKTVYGIDDDNQSVEQHTDILLDGGVTKQAKDVNTNDVLLVWDGISNSFVKTTVSKIRKKTNKLSYEVIVGDYTILVSPSHGFWLDGGDEIKVGDIKPNETKIYVKDGDDIKLLVVNEVNRIEGNEKVFITFEIPIYHNYVSNNIISHNAVGTGFPNVQTEVFGNRSGNLSFNATSSTTYYLRLRYEFNWFLSGTQYTNQRYAYYNSSFAGSYYGNALNAGTEINNAGFQVLSGQTRVFRADTNTLAANAWITQIGGTNVDFFVPKYSHHTYGNYNYGLSNLNIGYNKKAFPVTRAMCMFDCASNGTPTIRTPKLNVSTVTRSAAGIYIVTLEEGLGVGYKAVPMVSSYGRAGDSDSYNPIDNEFTNNMGAKYNTSAETYTLGFKDNDTNTNDDPYTVYFVVFG